MLRLERKHPRVVRWCHWLNAVFLAAMIWSGLLIYWASPVYRIGWGDVTWFHFFPPEFFEILNLKARLAEGMAWHFFFMWLFAGNGLVYVVYLAVSGEWRHLAPDRRSVQEVLHDLRLSKVRPPRRKFNAAQQLAYATVILMGAGSLATGLAIYKPVQFAWLTASLGGYEWARWGHFWLTLGYGFFFLVHITMVVRAGWNNLRGMVTGYELVAAEEVEHG